MSTGGSSQMMRAAKAERPPSPARTLQEGLGKAMQLVSAPGDAINMGIAKLTDGISKALPSFPAATMGSLVLGLPHSHPHPPSFGVPLPPLGAVTAGCCVSVLIGGLPAARCGDIGLSPTCLGYLPGFEIFTGSSKVFIGGARAARAIDVTMHCWPPKGWLARGAIAALTKAAMVGMKVMDVAGKVATTAGVIADLEDASASAAAGDSAMAAASAMSAGMAVAQAVADAIAAALGNVIGKDPAAGPPVGMITLGDTSVLIGGFPMPSGMQIAMRKLTSAEFAPKKRGDGDDNTTGSKDCG
jgi:uncharacterized Zn-binding protein involved in type VI secretion